MTSPNDPRDLTQAFTNPGASAVPNPEEVNNFHRYDDLDNFPESHHHTLGIDPNQSSPGDHTHDGRTSKVLQGYALTTHDHGTAGQTPTGSILAFGGSLPPDGWFLCNGQALERSTNAALFDVIGTTYGTTTATNFLVPNLSSRFPVGTSAAYPIATVGGSKDHEHSNGTASHSHTASGSDSGHSHGGGSHSHTQATHSHTESGHAHNVAVGAHAHTGTGGNHQHFVPAGTQNTASSAAAGSVTVDSHNIGTIASASGSGTGTGSAAGTTAASSIATTSNSAAVSVSVEGASTTAHTATIDKSLPPFLSLPFIIKG